MPITVNIQTGIPSSYPNPGDHFEWVNPTNTPVEIVGCGGFCTQSSYPVPAYGGTPAQINPDPGQYNFQERPSVWNPGGTNPGLPHIQHPSKVQEVA